MIKDMTSELDTLRDSSHQTRIAINADVRAAIEAAGCANLTESFAYIDQARVRIGQLRSIMEDMVAERQRLEDLSIERERQMYAEGEQ